LWTEAQALRLDSTVIVERNERGPMRKALLAAAAVLTLAAAGCGGSDTDELEAQIAELRRQVAAQQAQIEKLEQDTSSLRVLEQRVDDLLERIPNLDELGDLLGQLGIG
jgi:Tfp pilus assembly protein PilO